MKEVSNSNDLNLSQWGPYSTRTFGISCIHDPETGSRIYSHAGILPPQFRHS